VFQQTDADHYQLLAKVPSTLAREPLDIFWKRSQRVRPVFSGSAARADHGAEIWIYTVQD